VFGLHIIVILGNDRLLAGKIVVSGAQGEIGLTCNIPHRGLVKPLFAEEPQRRLKDVGPRVVTLAVALNMFSFYSAPSLGVKLKVNVFRMLETDALEASDTLAKVSELVRLASVSAAFRKPCVAPFS
jgi:hypothetical protein